MELSEASGINLMFIVKVRSRTKWSITKTNCLDVHWANKLESTGVPGRVHISGCTACYLRGSDFQLEDGDPRTDNNNGYPRPVEEWERLFEQSSGKVNLKNRFDQIHNSDEDGRTTMDIDIDREKCASTTWLVVDTDDKLKKDSDGVENGDTGINGFRQTVMEDPTKVALVISLI